MCLIIHQPEGHRVPMALLQSAAEYNPDGFGFMSLDAHGRPWVERSSAVSPQQLAALAQRSAGRDCAFHFRRRTRGAVCTDNLHPFKIADGLFLMHNGTAPVPLRVAGLSDSWHLARDYLAPLLSHRRKLIYDRSFVRILERWLGADNRLVFLDAGERRITALPRADGHEWNGLWLSNVRWLDRRLIGLGDHRTGVYRADEVRFC